VQELSIPSTEVNFPVQLACTTFTSQFDFCSFSVDKAREKDPQSTTRTSQTGFWQTTWWDRAPIRAKQISFDRQQSELSGKADPGKRGMEATGLRPWILPW